MVKSGVLHARVITLRLCVFFACGTLLFFAKRALMAEEATSPALVEVHVPAQVTEPEIERAIDLAVLARLAIEHGALETDPVAQQGLAEHVRALGLSASGSERVDLALRLGLSSIDPVLLQRLAFQGELLLRNELSLPEPREQDLQGYFAAHTTRYALPARVDVLQAFVSNDHEAGKRAQKLEQLESMLKEGRPFSDVAALSDVSMLPRSLKGVTARDLDKWFGHGFGDAVMRLRPGTPSGPLASAFGVHLVWVSRRTEAHTPSLSAVKERVRADLIEDQRTEALLRARRDLREHYEIKVRRGVTP